MSRSLQFPISDQDILSLHVGDSVLLSGVMITGRDAVHKWLTDTFIKKTKVPTESDFETYKAIQPILNSGAIYHCGPVVGGLASRDYRFVAAGPTTSIREEPYQGAVMRHFNLKGVIGKGGMAGCTLKACQEVPAVYLHAIGGAASLIAQSVLHVIGVHKLEFGVPEAIWVIEVKDFPAVVTMDAHGVSLHDSVRQHSQAILDKLLNS